MYGSNTRFRRQRVKKVTALGPVTTGWGVRLYGDYVIKIPTKNYDIVARLTTKQAILHFIHYKSHFVQAFQNSENLTPDELSQLYQILHKDGSFL